MSLPFTIKEFINVFKVYNEGIWPMQIVVYLLGFLALFLLGKKKKKFDRIITGILAFYWLWMGIFYHLLYFTSINKMAYVFGGIFIVEALLLLYIGVIKNYISFSYRLDIYSIIGGIFILYAMVIYPIIGYLFGHGYPFSPVFGVAPCPTTIFTFGVLLFANKIKNKHIIWIPLIWSIIGTFAAFQLGVKEDYGLFIAGVFGTVILLTKEGIKRKKIFGKRLNKKTT